MSEFKEIELQAWINAVNACGEKYYNDGKPFNICDELTPQEIKEMFDNEKIH